MFYTMNVAGLKRDLPICPVNESLYIAGFVIFGDPELTECCARELLKKAPEYDYIITAEAKGIPLAHEMARQAGVALGMSVTVAAEFGADGALVRNIILFSVLIYELVGPLMTKMALTAAGDIRPKPKVERSDLQA